MKTLEHPNFPSILGPRRVALAAALAAFMVLGRAHAAPTSDEARAKTQFEQGRAAMKSGDLTRARALLIESQGTVPKTATLMNLADCEERLGLYASALQHFQEAILLAAPGDDRIGSLKQRAHTLEPRVPKLQIDMKAQTTPEARVLLENRAIPTESLQTPRLMDPGEYTITVVTPGRLDRAYVVRLKEGETTVLAVEPGAEKPKLRPSPSAIPPAAPGTGGLGKIRITGIAVGGLGVAGLIVGAVTGAMAVSKKDQLRMMCPVPSNCTREGVALADEGGRLGTASTIGLAAGGAALALGVAGFILRPGTSASVAVGPDHGSVTLRWAF